MPQTLRDLASALSPPWLAENWGSRFMLTMGLLGDALAEGMVIALKAPWLRQRKSPPDALPLIGNETQMPRYDADTDTSYRRRLLKRWDTWLFAGTVEGEGDQGMTGQYSAAGFVATILNNFQWDFENPKDTEDWSRFVVVLELESGFRTWYYGDGTVYGSEPMSPTFGSTATQGQVAEAKDIARRWKTHHEINPCILVVLDGEYFGDPVLRYGSGAVYGGSTIKWPNMTPPGSPVSLGFAPAAIGNPI
jgi:hypothetical protein